jgi:hypothetical protein
VISEIAPQSDGDSREEECPRLAVASIDHGRSFARLAAMVKPT